MTDFIRDYWIERNKGIILGAAAGLILVGFFIGRVTGR